MSTRAARWTKVTLIALGMALAACATARERAKEEVLGAYPGLERPAVIVQTLEAGPYLNVVVQRADGSRSLYFTPDEACRAVLKEGNEVGFVNDRPFGRLTKGDVSCVPQGIGGLAHWRDRLTGGGTRRRARVRAGYTQVAAFEGGYALRGRFKLASMITWPGAYDTIALIGDSDACRAVAERAEASLEYRPSGAEALLLLAGSGPCPVEGFVRPAGVAAGPEGGP